MPLYRRALGAVRSDRGGNHAHRDPIFGPVQKAPWNKGHLTGQKRPLKPKDVWAIRVRLQLEGRKRDLLCSTLRSIASLAAAISSGFGERRVCRRRVHDRATVIQKKTGRPVQFEITEQTRAAIQDWLPACPGERGTCSRAGFTTSRTSRPANTPDRPCWVEAAGLDSSAYGTHSMRRTKVAQIYKKTGNLSAVQLLLGHTKLESTVRYLGIEVDDTLSISEQLEL